MKVIKQYFRQPILLCFAVVAALFSFIDTLLYYKGVVPDNFLVYFTWPASIILIVLSMSGFKREEAEPETKESGKWRFIIILACLTLIYWLTHMFKYNSAPWSDYALFDDAAWDIFLSKKHCFNSRVFEIIFWDESIGRISRELLFHYYITILFKVFGYNMRVFNFGLLLLGYTTLIFGTMVAKRLFKNDLLAFMFGMMFNFYPIYYTQVFMGHRYAICLPMLMISMYFVIRALQEKSGICGLAGGIFAGLTMESAIMGKQYLWALIGSLIVYVVLNLRQRKTFKDYIPMIVFGVLGYVIACTPLYSYIFTHKELYRVREAGLIAEFFENLKTNGISVIFQNVGVLFGSLFERHNYLRQFSSGFPILTWYYTVLLVAGVVMAFIKKWYLPILLIAIPMSGNVIATAYDFRILITAPAIILLIVAPVGFAIYKLFEKIKADKRIASGLIAVCVCVLLIEPVGYLYGLASDPNSQYYLNHRDLMASRYIQDVVADSIENASFQMKKNEFDRGTVNDRYDVFAATRSSYAHVNAFLEEYDNVKIMSLFGNFPYMRFDTKRLIQKMIRTVRNYEVTDKDLVIIFEHGEEVESILSELTGLEYVRCSEYEDEINASRVKMITLYINNSDIERFKQDMGVLF